MRSALRTSAASLDRETYGYSYSKSFLTSKIGDFFRSIEKSSPSSATLAYFLVGDAGFLGDVGRFLVGDGDADLLEGLLVAFLPDAAFFAAVFFFKLSFLVASFSFRAFLFIVSFFLNIASDYFLVTFTFLSADFFVMTFLSVFLGGETFFLFLGGDLLTDFRLIIAFAIRSIVYFFNFIIIIDLTELEK